MCRCIAMAAVTANAIRSEHARLIAVQRISHRQRFAGMTCQAFSGHRAREIRMRIHFIARSHVPHLPLRVVGQRRLEDMITQLHQVPERVGSRTDDEGRRLLAGCVWTCKTLGRPVDDEFSLRKAVLEAAIRHTGSTAEGRQRSRHSRFRVPRYFFWMASGARLRRIQNADRQDQQQHCLKLVFSHPMSRCPAFRFHFLLFALIAANASAQFVNITAPSGVHFQHVASHTSKKYLPETMGAGVALFDFDNDGRLDILFVNGATLADPTPKGSIPKKSGQKEWNRLFHQKADGTFEDVTEKSGLQGAGYGMGVAVGDFDNDGYEDLYVTALGGNKLYHNNGNGTFSDVTASAGVAGSGWSTSAAWVDLDNDGKLDLVVLRYMQWDFDDIYCGEHSDGGRAYCHPDTFKPVAPLVYHNEGGGHFSEVAEKLHLQKPGKGLGIAFADYDLDGHIDLFIANDSMPEFLYRNNGDGTFEERGLMAQVAVDEDGKTFAGMGADFNDINNDGYPDLIVDDLSNEMYALFENNKDGTFNYATRTSGLGRMTQLFSGWGVKLFDYDNDGWKDLVVAQGHDLDTIEKSNPHLRYRQPMLLAAIPATALSTFPPNQEKCSNKPGLRAAWLWEIWIMMAGSTS